MSRGRRGNGHRHTHSFTDQPTPVNANGKCVVAPLSTISDLIDMCATVAFVNNVSSAHSANMKLHALRATSVITLNGHWRSRIAVVFHTLSGTLPHTILTNSGKYAAPGSSYEIFQSDNESEKYKNSRSVPDASIEVSLHHAIRIVGSMIHESPDPVSIYFKDAVASRLRLFHKTELSRCPSLDSEDSGSGAESDGLEESHTSVHTRVISGTLETTPTTTTMNTLAFERPTFENAEDLFYSFAASTTDPNTFQHKAQPLIFYCKHPQ